MSIVAQRALISGWIVIVIMLAVSAVALANGRVQVFDRRVGGPYEIAVGTIPSTPFVGTLHFTIMVTDVVTDTSVLRPEIVVTGTGPESDAVEIGPITATSDPANPVFNDVATQVDRVGVWSFVISVSGDLGDASAEFPIEVKNSSPLIGIATLAALLGFVIVLGFSFRAYLRERGKGKSQA